LSRSLERAVRERLAGRSNLLVYDVGAGSKPYQPLFAPFLRRYVGLDQLRGPDTDLEGVAEALPLRSGSADVVLATQVLEHVDDPVLAVSELFRVLQPGGVAFVSCPGFFCYHPGATDDSCRVDYWRWTHTGLKKLFEQAGFQVDFVESCGANMAAIAGLLTSRLLALQLRPRRLLPILFLVINSLTEWGRRGDQREIPTEEGWGNIAINYLLVAHK
jgi:SAM-dependent methyltransferase